MSLVRFLAFVLIWTVLARAMLETHIHPLAIFAVWIAGFLWGTGYIIDGQRGGDALTIYTVGYWVALTVAGLVVVVAIS